jgi:basic amino acid/polyamine antiporter, APA family
MAASQTEPREQVTLRRAVTPAMLLVFVVGDMVGGGIYALVGEVGGRVGGALWTGFLLALLLAGLALWALNQAFARRTA